MPSNKVAKGQHRHSVVMAYLTAKEKEETARLARAVSLTQSDLVRLLLLTTGEEDVKRLKMHPGAPKS